MSSSPYTKSPVSPASRAYAITPADAPLPENIRAVYIGGAGDITGIPINQDTEVTFTGLLAGTVLPVMFRQISAATTATDLVGLQE